MLIFCSMNFTSIKNTYTLSKWNSASGRKVKRGFQEGTPTQVTCSLETGGWVQASASNSTWQDQTLPGQNWWVKTLERQADDNDGRPWALDLTQWEMGAPGRLEPGGLHGQLWATWGRSRWPVNRMWIGRSMQRPVIRKPGGQEAMRVCVPGQYNTTLKVEEYLIFGR